VLYAMVQRQAAVLAYVNMYQLFALATLMVIPLVMLMRRGAVTKEAMSAH